MVVCWARDTLAVQRALHNPDSPSPHYHLPDHREKEGGGEKEEERGKGNKEKEGGGGKEEYVYIIRPCQAFSVSEQGDILGSQQTLSVIVSQ